jgi:NADH-quinone oxidoreductase E subunit
MPVELNEQDKAAIAGILKKYPEKAAALLPVLHYVQRKLGHLPDEAQLLVADAIGVAATRVREVVTFYEMFHEHPEGQYHLELCTNISCHLLGGEELLRHMEKRLGVGVGHMTEDGVFSLMEVECLASCGSGPMMKVGEDYYEHLTAEAVDSLIDRFKKEAPSLEGRPYYCKNNKPHTGAVPGFESKLPVLNATPPPPMTNSAPPPLPPKPAEPKPAEAKPAEPAEAPKDEAKTSGLPSFEAPKPKKPEAT